MSESMELLGLSMPFSDAEPESPEWWRDRLLGRIAMRRPEIDLIADYVEGRHRMAFSTNKYKELFGELLSPLRDDWISVVAEAPVERLVVDGFRFGDAGQEGDKAAWDIWQENGLDARAAMAHDEAVKFGAAYVAIAEGPRDGSPALLVLPPTRAVIERDPSRPTERLAGMQIWWATDGTQRTRLWTRDGWWEWAGENTLAPRWEVVGEGANRIGVVPIVPLVNRPTLRKPEGQSDVWPVIPVQDAINKLLADMVVASEFAAFRQRWITGIEVPKHPVTGKPMNDQFITGIERMFTVKNPDARFGEFSATDLSNYTRPVELLVQHIAAQTRTPPHYLMGQMVNVSSEALRAAETGLVSRVRAKQLTFGEGWEEAMRIAFLWMGDSERADQAAAEVMWRDPETRTEGERVDALMKLQALGVPREALWARIPGVTPQEISRWRDMAARQAIEDGLTFGITPNGAPIEPPAPGPPPNQTETLA